MGTYATTTSLETFMIGTTFDNASTALATQCITWAETEINKYLSRRYDVSLFVSGSVPPVVTTWAEWMSSGYFYLYNSRGGKDSRERGKELIKEAKANLMLVAERKLDIVDSNGDAVVEDSNKTLQILSSTDEYSETFSEDGFLSWKVDQDKLDDIASDRG